MEQGGAPRFAVIIQGAQPWAGIAEGIDGVKETLLRVLWRDPAGALLGEVAALIDELGDPDVWAVHGAGDGVPFWHWWLGYEGGSITVQRLTAPVPPSADEAREARLAEGLAALDRCADALRGLAGPSFDLARMPIRFERDSSPGAAFLDRA